MSVTSDPIAGGAGGELHTFVLAGANVELTCYAGEEDFIVEVRGLRFLT